ncbi:MAG TPA: ABC transporter substrate-binding protein, partial [Acidimicrobiales bacterium]
MRRLLATVGALLVAATVLGACGDDGETGAGAPQGSESTGDAVNGGGLTFAVWSETNGLDPTVSYATGVIGGTELMAIYDTLMRYDPETNEYYPGMAESLTPNADMSVWELKLREGVTFTDGTPYDAEAVKFNIERHAAQGSRSSFAAHVSTNIQSIEVVDELTVRFHLTAPLASFPYILTVGPGMIGSVKAIEEKGDQFNLSPVGAGPFMVEKYAPGDELVLVRNPDYWAGPVPLDSVRFVNLGADAARYEQLAAGGADVVFLRDPEVVARAKEERPNNLTENSLSSPFVL